MIPAAPCQLHLEPRIKKPAQAFDFEHFDLKIRSQIAINV